MQGRLGYGPLSRHIRANVIGYVALFVALGGSAIAAQKVGPKQIAKNAVRAKHVKKDQVKTKHLAPAAVTADKLDPGAIPELTIEDGSITTQKLADQAVGASKLADSAATNPKIANNAVSTGKLTDLAVSSEKLDNSAVTRTKIANGEVRAPDLGPILQRSAIVNVPAGSTAAASASCDPGEIAITGGAAWGGVADLGLVIQDFFRTDTAWTARGGNTTGTDRTLTVLVNCLLP